MASKSAELDTNKSDTTLFDFSDCVLLNILSYLTPYDLYCLSKTCLRFKYLVEDRKLWRRMNVLAHPMCARKFQFFFENVNKTTDTIMVSGITKKEKTLTYDQFQIMLNMCQNLTILAIENQYINSDEIGLRDFPDSLKELSLRGTHIYGRTPFLHDAHSRLKVLHTLILDDCKWFHEHSLMALSKLCSLENLSLYKCGNLNDSVAYMSITAKFGFRKLLRIDARCTAIGDQFLKCFHCIKTLREIYLEAPLRREKKKKALLEEIKILANSGKLETPKTAVVFKGCNIVERQPRKQPRKPKLPLNHTGYVSNCLENCFKCSLDTCSIIQNQVPSTLDATRLPEAPPRFDFPVPVDTYHQSDNESSPADYTRKTWPWLAAPEVLHCDDVSDSEEEMSDFDFFHPDVTDSGVQWFCTTDPNAVDDLGSESFLFRKPYGECSCGKKKKKEGKESESSAGESSSREIDNIESYYAVPGPSGINKKKRKRIDAADHSTTSDSPSSPSPAKRRYFNDLTMNISRQGSVSVQIAYDESSDSDDDTEPPATAAAAPTAADLNYRVNNRNIIVAAPILLQNNRQDDLVAQIYDDNIIANNPVIRESIARLNQGNENVIPVNLNNQPRQNLAPVDFINFPPGEGEQRQRALEVVLNGHEDRRGELQMPGGRDLRVIIERLDPGFHIVYDQGAGVRFANPNLKNYTTKLKVFVARGYKLITNQALLSLQNLRLELLDVTGTNVNAKGVREFLLVNPDCRVIHESTCNCN